MTKIEASLAVYWALMAAMSVVMATFRRPLARWTLRRLSGSTASPSAHRACERSLLLAGIGLVIISITALYGAVILLPRLHRTLEQIRSTRQVTCPAAEGQEI